MTLRIKILLAIIIATLLLAGMLALASKAILFRSYLQLEENRVRADIDIALSAIDSQQEQLRSFAQDWAAWDETYQFAQNLDQGYIDRNLLDETFVNMRLNLFAVVTTDDQIIYEKAFNLLTLNETTPPRNWLSLVSELLDLESTTETTISKSEILILNNTPWLISTHPIITSRYEGPMQGILVVGRALTLPELNNISESIHLPIDIQDTSSQKMKSDFTQALQNLRETNQTKYINPLNEEWISGYTLLRDHDNQPGLILRIMEKREFYNHAKSFNLYFISAVILIGLFFGIGINLLIDRNIIRRLDVINQAMDQVRQQKDLSTRIYLPGNDEIASLAHKINLTFAALQYSNQALLDNEARLSQTSRHDGLTNLPNRVALIDRLNKVGELNSSNHLAAVLLIDLDRFKLINDSFDHQAGDKVLVETARRIASCLPDNAFLARPGGDEFVVVLNELKSQREASDAAKTILNVISTPYEIQDRNIFLSASIGIATTQSAQQVDDLLRNADLAMYHAKSRGKGRFEIFTNAMHATSLGLLQMENDLRRGIEQEEFILHYQPIIRLDTGRIDMVEVLVRWQHPTSGLLYPGEFLPVAEDTGLIVPLNEWVMISAARQLLDWHDMGYTFLNLAVNVPAQQLQDPSFKSFIEKYEPQLAEKAFSVQVEITENTAMADFDLAINYLAYMRDRGVRIAIDDFGTGYSSLAYLQRFPVDCVKIDRSFLEDYQSNATLLEAIIAMGHALGLEVTAEGVETYDQLKFLSRLGCDKAQGFLFCRPVSPEVIGEILAQHPQGDFVKNIPTNSWGKQT